MGSDRYVHIGTYMTVKGQETKDTVNKYRACTYKGCDKYNIDATGNYGNYCDNCGHILEEITNTKKEIISVDPIHTAKTLVLVYMCFSLPIMALFFIDAYFRYGEVPLFAVLSGAFLNALLGFLILWLACIVYNWVAKTFGGIELDLKEIDVPNATTQTTTTTDKLQG